jgi:hypothetical protein
LLGVNLADHKCASETTRLIDKLSSIDGTGGVCDASQHFVADTLSHEANEKHTGADDLRLTYSAHGT